MNIKWFGLFGWFFDVNEFLLNKIMNLENFGWKKNCVKFRKQINKLHLSVEKSEDFHVNIYFIKSIQIIQLIDADIDAGWQQLLDKECMMFSLIFWENNHIIQFSVNEKNQNLPNKEVIKKKEKKLSQKNQPVKPGIG